MNKLGYKSRTFLLASAAVLSFSSAANAQGQEQQAPQQQDRLRLIKKIRRSLSPRKSAKSGSRMFRSRSVSSIRSRY